VRNYDNEELIHQIYNDDFISDKKYAKGLAQIISLIDNPENKPFVNHIDGNKTNNSVNNL
jgi:hypothetical protein